MKNQTFQTVKNEIVNYLFLNQNNFYIQLEELNNDVNNFYELKNFLKELLFTNLYQNELEELINFLNHIQNFQIYDIQNLLVDAIRTSLIIYDNKFENLEIINTKYTKFIKVSDYLDNLSIYNFKHYLSIFRSYNEEF